MIVSIHKHVIARQPRFFVTHDSHRTWTLHVKRVTEQDRGNYMCQVNSNQMISQTGYLQVVGELLSFAMVPIAQRNMSEHAYLFLV